MAIGKLDFGFNSRGVVDPYSNLMDAMGARGAMATALTAQDTKAERDRVDSLNREKMAAEAKQRAFTNKLATSSEARAATEFQNKQDELDRIQQQRKAINTAMISPDIFTNPEAEYIGTKFDSLGTDQYDSMTDAEKAEYNKSVEELTSRLTSTYDTRVSSPLMTSKQAAANMQRSLINQGVDATTAIDIAAKYGASITPAAPDTKALQEMAKVRFTERNKAIRENAKGTGSSSTTKKNGGTGVNLNATIDPEVYEFVTSEYWGKDEDKAIRAATVLSKLGLSKEQQKMFLDMANPSKENLWENIASFDKFKASGLAEVLPADNLAIIRQYVDKGDPDLLARNLTVLKAKEGYRDSSSRDADLSQSEAAYIRDMQTAMSPNEVDRRAGMSLEELTFGKSPVERSTTSSKSTPKKPTGSQVKELQEALVKENIPTSKGNIDKEILNRPLPQDYNNIEEFRKDAAAYGKQQLEASKLAEDTLRKEQALVDEQRRLSALQSDLAELPRLYNSGDITIDEYKKRKKALEKSLR